MKSVYKKLCLLILCPLLVLTGCATRQVHNKSSVIEYLYPASAETKVSPSTPHLELPLTVGIAFVPQNNTSSKGHDFWTGVSHSSSISEAQKSGLLEKVADNFRALEFVDKIEVIPSAYLTPGGSFTNLKQIQTMYGIDVIALVSYDQVQFTDEGALSLSYWTIVGAYIISGEKNDTNTLMDTVVYDIASQKMLFRAPGTSSVKGKATPVNLSEALRKDSLTGFEQAADNMVVNLKTQLDKFQQSLKADPTQAKITHKAGYSGGGALGTMPILILLLVSLFCLARKFKKAI